MSRVSSPAEVPEDIVERVRTLCLAVLAPKKLTALLD
jgi:hypothetical protein